MLFQVIGAMAELELAIIRERVVAGIERAKCNGVALGRPRVKVDVEEAKRLRKEGLSYRAIAERLGISVGKVYATISKVSSQ